MWSRRRILSYVLIDCSERMTYNSKQTSKHLHAPHHTTQSKDSMGTSSSINSGSPPRSSPPIDPGMESYRRKGLGQECDQSVIPIFKYNLVLSSLFSIQYYIILYHHTTSTPIMETFEKIVQY